MLPVCSIRWSVEIYFKEAEQHLGFLSEQTRSFASFIASIHLCAILHLLPTQAALIGHGQNDPEVREQIKEQLGTLCFERSLDLVMQTIDRNVDQFPEISLQLDGLSLKIDDASAVSSS